MIAAPMERIATGRGGHGDLRVSDLAERLGPTLAHLDRVAELPPERLVEEAPAALPSLQYELHSAAELAVGLEPPSADPEGNGELVAALSHARDATADVAAALEARELQAVESALPQWRGALFRARLARLRAVEGSAGGPGRRSSDLGAPLLRAPGSAFAALAAVALVVTGALLFTAGAVLAAWPLWAAGLALFAGGFLLVRP